MSYYGYGYYNPSSYQYSPEYVTVTPMNQGLYNYAQGSYGYYRYNYSYQPQYVDVTPANPGLYAGDVGYVDVTPARPGIYAGDVGYVQVTPMNPGLARYAAGYGIQPGGAGAGKSGGGSSGGGQSGGGSSGGGQQQSQQKQQQQAANPLQQLVRRILNPQTQQPQSLVYRQAVPQQTLVRLPNGQVVPAGSAAAIAATAQQPVTGGQSTVQGSSQQYSGTSIAPYLLMGGAGIAAYLAFKKKK